MKKSLQSEGVNDSEHSRQDESKRKGAEAKRSLASVSQSKKGAHVAEVAWDGRAQCNQLGLNSKGIKEATEDF